MKKKKSTKEQKSFFHYFGIFCIAFIALYLLAYSITSGVNRADKYVQSNIETANKYFVCSQNFRELGEKLCNHYNSSYSYYKPVDFAFGKDVEFEYIQCKDGELFSLSGEFN